MIVSGPPRPGRAWKRLIVPVVALLVWDVGVTLLYFGNIPGLDGISIQYSLYGTAIALFLGFMVNAAYARWWEARTLWGQIVNSSRSLGREAVTLLDRPSPDARPGLAAEIVRAQVAYVHSPRTNLRRQHLAPEVARNLAPES